MMTLKWMLLHRASSCYAAMLFRAFYLEITAFLLPEYQKYLSVFLNSPDRKSIRQLHERNSSLRSCEIGKENQSSIRM